jgi:hypothetical protein
MKKFGDAVVYVRHDGEELNALVVASSMIGGEEHLQLAYFDPEIGQLMYRTHSTPSTAFSVPPMKDGARTGWIDVTMLPNYRIRLEAPKAVIADPTPAQDDEQQSVDNAAPESEEPQPA